MNTKKSPRFSPKTIIFDKKRRFCLCIWRFQVKSDRLLDLGHTAVFADNIPSPHAHYLCWRTGMMDRWECAAFAEWLKKAVA